MCYQNQIYRFVISSIAKDGASAYEGKINNISLARLVSIVL